MIKLAIVGSRTIDDFQILDCFALGAMAMHGISLWDITHVVSGGAIGVDKMAEKLIKKYKNLKIEPIIHKPDYERYGKNLAPKERNTLIAEDCDAAIVIWNGYSGGTWDTLNKVRNLDKPYIMITVRVQEATKRSPKKQKVSSIDFRGNWENLYEEKVHSQRNSGKPTAAR
jgi:hypothetical protein